MKRSKLKIWRGLKTALAVASIVCLGALHTFAKPQVAVKATYSFVGMAFTLKGRKVEGEKTAWDMLDAGTQKYIEESDKVLKEAFEKTMSKEDLEAKLTEFKTQFGTGLSAEKQAELDEMVESVKKHAEFIQKYKDPGFGANARQNAFKQAWEENAEKIKQFREKGIKALEFEVKATQAPGDIADHTIGTYVDGIGQIPVRKPFMEDLFPSINCDLEFIKYMDQETAVRDAKNHGVAEATTHNTKLTWKERFIKITGVRDFIHIPIDMMSDYNFVEGEIRNLLISSVQLKVDNGLLKDSGATPEMHSVDEACSDFDATNTLGGTIESFANTVPEANIFDLVLAMSAQIIAMGKDGAFIPDTVLLNTVARYKSMLIKDKNGQYLMPPFVVKHGNNEWTIDNMRVRSNPNVPANSCYVFDSSKGLIYNRLGLLVEMSYDNNDNFEKEVVTIKARRRVNFLVRNAHKNAFMRCTDVKAALIAIQQG